MEVVKMTGVAQFKSPKGITARKLMENDSFIIMNLLFKPGEVLEKHKTPVDVFFYVVKGKGFIEIGDQESLVEATDIVFSPKGIPHGLRALPDDEFQVLVVKNPLSD